MASSVEPLMVSGGFAVAEHVESRTEDGWEVDYEWLSSIVYPTREACEAAIAEMFGGRAAA